MIISKDILVHHISRYTNIKSTYNLFTTCKDLYKHIDEVLNLDDEPITSITSSISRDRRILIFDSIYKTIDNLNEFKLLEIIHLNLFINLEDDINLSYPSISTLVLHQGSNTNILLHDNLESLNICMNNYNSTFNINYIPHNLKSLTINNIEATNIHSYIKYLQYNCKQLEYLNVSCIYKEYVQPIVINEFNNLHTLKFKDIYNIEISNLKKLKRLSIRSYKSIMVRDLEVLERLSMYSRKQSRLNNLPLLRSLKLVDNTIINNSERFSISNLILKSYTRSFNLKYKPTLFSKVESIKVLYYDYDVCYNMFLKYIPKLKSLTLITNLYFISNNCIIKDYKYLKDLYIDINIIYTSYTLDDYTITMKNLPSILNISILHFYQYNKSIKDFNVSKNDKLIKDIIIDNSIDIKNLNLIL